MRALKRDFLPRDLKPLLDANGFEGCIAVQAALDVRETEWLLDLADENDWVRGVVGWVDLCAQDVEGELERLSARKKLRGIRHVVQGEPDPRFMLREDFQRGVAALARFDLVYDLLIHRHQFGASTELAARFPAQRFVLDHLGKPAIRGRERAGWAADMRALAAHTNVACKLSGMVTEADVSRWQASDFEFYLETAFDAFGPRRLLIGSDWPVCLLGGQYARVVDIVLAYLAGFSRETRAAVTGDNAARIYAL